MINLTIISAIALSIIWHEACHALALLAVGVKVRVIQIGTPVIYRRGIFALGLYPFYGGVVAEDLTAVPRPAQVLYFAGGPAGNLLMIKDRATRTEQTEYQKRGVGREAMRE